LRFLLRFPKSIPQSLPPFVEHPRFNVLGLGSSKQRDLLRKCIFPETRAGLEGEVVAVGAVAAAAVWMELAVQGIEA
jgi:hypothetical protein